MNPTSSIDAFMELLGPVEYGPAACWPWPFRRRMPTRDDYVYNGKTNRHRESFELFYGPIPPGLEIDHVRARGCTTKRCVNPAHLEAVTHSENVKRSRAADNRAIRKAIAVCLIGG